MKMVAATSSVLTDAPHRVPGETLSNAGTTEKTVYIVMAGGGTGGHIYPGLAVLEALQPSLINLRRPVKIIWAATPRPIDQRLLGSFDFIRQSIRPWNSNPFRWPGFYVAWHQTCHYWQGFFSEHQVAAVLALGGYAAGAVAYEAARRKIPVGLLNPDALAGRANRFLMGRADAIFTQWPLDSKTNHRFVSRTQVVGCPVRRTMVPIPRTTAATRLALHSDCKTLVITGASLGAQTINRAIALLLADPEIQQFLNTTGGSRWQILHLAGLEHAAELRAHADRLTTIPWKVLDYCDDMAAVWSMADLAITRAGAGTCAELACMGVPAILMPYPFHKDRHQEANAEILAVAGAAVIVHDAKNDTHNAAALKSMLLRLLSEPDRLADMAMAARLQARPQAAQAVARWLLEQIQLQCGETK